MKRTSLRSYGASNKPDLAMKSTDYLIHLSEVDTTDTLFIFTNKGKYIPIPVYELPDIRWKDPGNHLSNLTTFSPDEKVVNCIPIREFKKDKFFVFITKNGMIKKSEQEIYQSTRYSRSLIALNLRKEDELVNVFETDGSQHIFIATHFGYGLLFSESEVSPIGQRALGVIGIQLKENDFVVNGMPIYSENDESLFMLTQRGACKRMSVSKFEVTSRARRGMMMLRELKTKPHRVIYFTSVTSEEKLFIETEKKTVDIVPYSLPLSERNSNGSFVIDIDIDGMIKKVYKDTNYETPFASS